jgi:parallel beta-helix repeat protein
MKLLNKRDALVSRALVRSVTGKLGAFFAVASCAYSANYYVAKTGNDDASGGISTPWKTVAKAVSVASAGDTVYFRGGEWNERLLTVRSGTAGNPITFRNYPGEIPVLDATGLPFSGDPGVIEIFNNRHDIVIDGFEVRNLITIYTSKVPIGIKIVGESGTSPKNISILNCNVHSIRNTHNSDGANAHGIIVRGESTDPIRNIVISGNKVHDCILGQSEALVVNGNVDGFEITDCTVYNNNNIGIDIIGYEGNISASLDFARNGVVSDNLVYNCSSITNPGYGEYSAGGIYVDGGANILIERNKVYSCDIGIELASEHPNKSTNNITVRNNVLWKNNMGGIFTGGYESGLGSTDNCTITNNTLYQNDTIDDWSGEILIRDHTHNLTIKNNILIAAPRTNVLIQKDSSNTSGIVIDYNLYYASAGQNGSEWQWKTGSGDGYRTGYNNWKSGSGQDSHSTWGLAPFNKVSGAVGGFDFCYATGALPVDKGDPNFTPAVGETDISGGSRLLGIRVDTGAHEVGQPALTVLETWRQEYFGSTANAGNGADHFDYDKDGVVNLMEFAVTGGNPTKSDAIKNGGVLAVSRLANGSREMVFPRNSAAAALITYKLQGSAILSGSWSALATRNAGGTWITTAGVSVSESGGIVTVMDSRTASAQYFYSLIVEN